MYGYGEWLSFSHKLVDPRLISLIERMGKVFTPVKYDMQGNLDNLIKIYGIEEDTCLLIAIKGDIENSKPTAVEAVVWLNRTLLFFEIMFEEIIKCLKSNACDVRMKKIYTVAYEGSVKKYHNWVTQQLFSMICKMSPTLPQILKSLEVDNIREFELFMITYNQRLMPVRCAIEDVLITKGDYS